MKRVDCKIFGGLGLPPPARNTVHARRRHPVFLEAEARRMCRGTRRICRVSDAPPLPAHPRGYLLGSVDVLPPPTVATALENALPVDSESQLHMVDEEQPLVKDIQLILPDNVATRLDEFTSSIRATDKLAAAGIRHPARLLLYDPPGCGKTQAASAGGIQFPHQFQLFLLPIQIERGKS